jgi:hypothetical protein
MQLGFVTAILPDLTLPEILAFASALDPQAARLVHRRIWRFSALSPNTNRERADLAR